MIGAKQLGYNFINISSEIEMEFVEKNVYPHSYLVMVIVLTRIVCEYELWFFAYKYVLY